MAYTPNAIIEASKYREPLATVRGTSIDPRQVASSSFSNTKDLLVSDWGIDEYIPSDWRYITTIPEPYWDVFIGKLSKSRYTPSAKQVVSSEISTSGEFDIDDEESEVSLKDIQSPVQKTVQDVATPAWYSVFGPYAGWSIKDFLESVSVSIGRNKSATCTLNFADPYQQWASTIMEFTPIYVVAGYQSPVSFKRTIFQGSITRISGTLSGDDFSKSAIVATDFGTTMMRKSGEEKESIEAESFMDCMERICKNNSVEIRWRGWDRDRNNFVPSKNDRMQKQGNDWRFLVESADKFGSVVWIDYDSTNDKHIVHFVHKEWLRANSDVMRYVYGGTGNRFYWPSVNPKSTTRTIFLPKRIEKFEWEVDMLKEATGNLSGPDSMIEDEYGNQIFVKAVPGTNNYRYYYMTEEQRQNLINDSDAGKISSSEVWSVYGQPKAWERVKQYFTEWTPTETTEDTSPGLDMGNLAKAQAAAQSAPVDNGHTANVDLGYGDIDIGLDCVCLFDGVPVRIDSSRIYWEVEEITHKLAGNTFTTSLNVKF